MVVVELAKLARFN